MSNLKKADGDLGGDSSVSREGVVDAEKGSMLEVGEEAESDIKAG